MIAGNSTDEEWFQWIEVQKSATYLWIAGDLPGAIEIIDHFVDSKPPRDLERQAIGFRGSLHQERGDLVAAKVDFLAARELAESPDFERCTLEESAAAVSYQLGDTAEAERWYLEALKTAAADPCSSGATALLHLLKIRGESGLSLQERLLAESVLKQAWHFHELPGTPVLDDLPAVARVIVQAQCTPKHGE